VADGADQTKSDAIEVADPLAPRRRNVRWLDAIVSTLIGVAVAWVLGVAAPSLLVAAGVVDQRPSAAAPVVRRSDPPGLFREHDFDPDDDSGPVDPRSRGRADRERRVPPFDGDRDGGSRALGLARRELTLVDGPEEGAVPIGRVPAGEVVLLLRDVDDWLLVIYSGADGTAMGWVQKNAIAVR
jgi:hypothetical protein